MKPGSIDGIEGCRRIKKTMQKRTKSKLSYCVKGQKNDIQEGENAGADAHLMKPFSSTSLFETINVTVTDIYHSS